MKYKGKIGEFSFWKLGLALCVGLLIGFSVYLQFTFVAPPSASISNPTPDPTAKRIMELESQVRDLNGRILGLEKKIGGLESDVNRANAKGTASSRRDKPDIVK